MIGGQECQHRSDNHKKWSKFRKEHKLYFQVKPIGQHRIIWQTFFTEIREGSWQGSSVLSREENEGNPILKKQHIPPMTNTTKWGWSGMDCKSEISLSVSKFAKSLDLDKLPENPWKKSSRVLLILYNLGLGN